MKLLIVLHHRFELWNAPAWLPERLRRDFPQLEVVHLPGYEGVERHLPAAEVAIAWSLRPEQFLAAKKLRWIHSPAAAVHQLLFPELVASNVVLTNAREVHGPVVAEHGIALIFALAKRLPVAMRLQLRRDWGQERMWSERPRPREVMGAILGLIGFGSIGGELARRALALGMRVLVVREHPEKSAGDLTSFPVSETHDFSRAITGQNKNGTLAPEIFGLADLDRVLEQSDFVVLAAPLTEKTREFINAERLAHMGRDAYFINLSRGALVDEPALIAALRHKRIAGAALDVFAAEPLPADSPLWEVDNLLITPHTAAVTEQLWERHYALFSDNLRRYLAGQPLRGVVDKKKGY